MVVQHNISAMTANRYYTNNNSALGKSMEKLSSGLAINRAGDNAAGLAVSEKMRAQIGGLTQASKNAQDGISMVQTFEGALQETDSILQRMRTLAVQSANGSYQSDVDRDAIQLEFNQLNQELNEIADTDYNGVIVLNGGRMTDGTNIDDTSKQSTLPTITSPTDSADVKFVYSSGGSAGSSTPAGPTVAGSASGDLSTLDPDDNTTSGTLTLNGTAVTVTSDGAGGTTLSTAATGMSVTGTVSADGSGTVDVTQTVKVTPGNDKDADTVADDATISIQDENGITKDYLVASTTNGTGVVTANTVKIYEKAEDGSRGEDVTGNFTITRGDDTGESESNKDILIRSTASYTVAADGKISSGEGEIGTSDMPASEDSAPATPTADPNAVSKSNTFTQGSRDFTYANSMTLQVGARSKDAVEFTFKYSANGLGELQSDMDASARGLGTDQLDLTSQKGANFAIDRIDNAINKVSMIRGTFGAIQNRLEHKISNLDTNAENLTAAESRIRDTQMDQEMMKFTSAQILSQASQSMLAQANSLPQGVLQLLG